MQAVFIGIDGQPYLIWQDMNGGWHNFGQLPNPTGTEYAAIATGNGNLGMLQVMLLGRNDGQPYLIWQDTNGGWHDFGQLPNPAVSLASLAAGVGNSRQLQMICIGKNDGQPYLVWQDASGGWHNFGQLPNPNVPFVTIATGVGNQNQLQVICVGKYDGQPYLIWQDPNGGWHNFGKLPNPSQTPPGSGISSVFVSVATGNGNAGMLQVVLLESGSGRPRLVWQDTQGNWHPYSPAQGLVAFG